MDRKRDLEPMASVLDGVLAKIGVGRAPDVLRLMAEWDVLAGGRWVGVSRPVVLKSGRLIVEVRDGAVASLLKYQVQDLLGRLQSELGAGVIDSVHLRLPGRPVR